MFARYIITVAALVDDEIKLKTFVVEREYESDEMDILCRVLFPTADTIKWSISIMQIDVKDSDN